ncbi:shikimate dehydrogenase family protein [Cupriavidus pauculus]|uniref:shikimate dehydrogenase (NADP(+)) n=1 Tax=Cupriavidus pauculus TaxID=82633 RepID=A0A2N5C2J3_9BURK|nr:shikimate dehydrogenase [Cupriavidus pauculus]PLP96444.1 shikimate dehydrogenase [Cupriavidus pauculus]
MHPANLPPVAAINGQTRVVVILAYPTHHVRTPGFFNAYMAETGNNAVLVPWQVAPAQLAETVRGLREVENLAGLIVTVPHKQAMARLCDELEGIAADLDVCNVVRRTPDGRLIGAMYDGVGFVEGMRRNQIDPRGKRTLLLGAGGAATAVAAALLDAGVAQLTVVNRTPEKAEDLVALLRARQPGAAVQAAVSAQGVWDLVVNGTSLGLKPDDPLPLDPALLCPDTIVAEVIMQPAETALLTAARARGCPVHRGEHMVTAQIQLLAEFLLDNAHAQ